jgi:hypothetical protein
MYGMSCSNCGERITLVKEAFDETSWYFLLGMLGAVPEGADIRQIKTVEIKVLSVEAK